jgi:hypothetical protein
MHCWSMMVVDVRELRRPYLAPISVVKVDPRKDQLI